MTSAIRRNAGRKAKTSGTEFEKYLVKWVFPEPLRTGFFKRIDKLNPDHSASGKIKGRTVFSPTARSGADWVALGGIHCRWQYVAIEAKSVNGDSLGRSALTDEQVAHLQAARDENQLGLLLVRFNAGIYALRWTERLLVKRGNGESVRVEDIDPALKLGPTNSLSRILSTYQFQSQGYTG